MHYYPLEVILTRAWTTDAHTTAYSVEGLPYRLSRDAVLLSCGVAMVLFCADVDCAQSHAAGGGQGDVPAPDDWWLQELEKMEASQRAFPGAFVYRTRGRYRVVYLLPKPQLLRSPADVDAWKADYLAWVAALRLRFQLYADSACHDWQRLYRVPHATRRRGHHPEGRETLGDPHRIGLWTCEPTTAERELAKTLAKRPGARLPSPRVTSAVTAGNGVFFCAFKACGWVGKAVEAGKWHVRCPWDAHHTKGKACDGSTVLYAPGAGYTLDYLHCSHAHCQHRAGDPSGGARCATGGSSGAERGAQQSFVGAAPSA